MRIVLSAIFLMFLLTSCAIKEPLISSSATILIKTPSMKFYDRGFINIFPTYTQVQVFSAGNLVLNLKIYEERICRDTFECQTLKQFNKEYLSSTYADDFLKKLFCLVFI